MFYGFAIVVGINLSKKIDFWIKLMKIGALTGCHQMYGRSFSVYGYQFPVCARCTGLGLGQFFGFIFSFVLLKYNIFIFIPPAIFSLMILGIDGLGQFYKKWESTNLRRLITGSLCGFFVILFFNKIIYELLKIIVKYNSI
jgi:uncharacterized membrane protein